MSLNKSLIPIKRGYGGCKPPYYPARESYLAESRTPDPAPCEAKGAQLLSRIEKGVGVSPLLSGQVSLTRANKKTDRKDKILEEK